MTNLLKQELSHTTNEIIELNNELLNMPDGKLSYQKTGKYIKYFNSRNGQREYIKKNNINLAAQLAKKEYIKNTIKDLEYKQEKLAKLITSISNRNSLAEKTLNNQVFSALLQLPNNDNQFINEWVAKEYETNPVNQGNLKFKCISGNYVRSKSEFFIDQALFLNNLPFRYECRLELKNGSIYPDFTILYPATMSQYYWEHFGMMDNPEYAYNAFKKIQQYYSNGIIPGINLIMTFETKDVPFSYDIAESIIKQYFHPITK